MRDLTTQELSILSLIAEGKTSKEVADVLFCSKRTVDFHLSKIYQKLGVSNRVQAIRRSLLLQTAAEGMERSEREAGACAVSSGSP